MAVQDFLRDEKGVVATEYVVFVAAIGTILVLGVYVLFNAMSGMFSTWANYFNAG
jgi:Flp pilus assembly pilin Flp